ncbi:endoplasmic reticulum protein [Trametopsis cervina]|nr:endoplasmic reticulum protein [Trametopsis cervina]
MSTLLQVQPFKGLYLLFEAFATTLVRVPLWALIALRRSNRPKATWPIRRVLTLWWLHHRNKVYGRVGGVWRVPDYRALEQQPHVKGLWIAPAPELVVGEVQEWAKITKVECIRLPGYWLEKEGADISINARPQLGEKVLYALHGGGYVTCSAHPDDGTSNVARGILKHAGPHLVRAFQIEYRNSRPPTETPSNPFPAALIDAIAGYNYLVHEVGFSPEDIVVCGDSAGANLALALVRYLVENQNHADAKIPGPPSALILSSPWGDLGPEPEDKSSSVFANVPTDFITMAGPGYVSQTHNFFGPLGPSAGVTNRYISPASTSPLMGTISFKGFPRTYISNGGSEILRDQIRILRDKMETDMGSDVKYVEYPDAWHDFLAFPEHEPERSEALHIMADWLKLGY